MTALRFTARPTSYRGIQMRSRLEAVFAAWMDDRDIVWEYEPLCYADQAGSYMPDFRLPDVEVPIAYSDPADESIGVFEVKTGAFIEVKPPVDSIDLGAVLDGMQRIWDTSPDTMLAVASPRGDLLRFPYRLRAQDRVFTSRHGCWLACEHCGATGVGDLAQADYDFFVGDASPRVCTTCERVGAEVVSPWRSQQYRQYTDRMPSGGGR